MKRFMSVVMLLTLLMTALAGCGGKAEQPAAAPADKAPAKAPEPAKKEPVTITLWVIDAFTKSPDAPLYKAIQEFEKANEGIKVEVQPFASNAIRDKIVTSVSGGEGPDVVSVDIAWLGEFAAMGLLQDITKEFGPSKDQFFDGPINAVTQNGKLYAVPWYTNNVGIYYNKEAFEKAGITKVPETWDEFYDAAKKLKANGYTALSVARSGFANYFFTSFLYQNGGQFFSPDGKKLVVNSPEAVEAFAWFTGLYTELKAMPESVKSAFSWDEVYAPFIQGKSAMFISGDWARFTLQKNAPDMKWGVAPMPKGKQYATVAGGYNFAIGKNSKDKEAAWKLISYLTNEQNHQAILEKYNRIPARKSVVDSDYAKKDAFAGMFITQAKHGVPQPSHPAWPKINDLMGEAFDAVIQGQKTPQQALDDVVKKGQPIVDSLGN